MTNSNLPLSILQAALLGGATVMAALAIEAVEVRAGDLVVLYDQSQLVRLTRPASEIIIGNPSIADVSVQGGTLLVVTGKTFGITNIIALDAERQIIHDQRVIVERDQQRVVNLHKGSARQSYSCTSSCSPTITIGDDDKYFQAITSHSTAKTKFSTDGSDGNQQGTQ